MQNALLKSSVMIILPSTKYAVANTWKQNGRHLTDVTAGGLGAANAFAAVRARAVHQQQQEDSYPVGGRQHSCESADTPQFLSDYGAYIGSRWIAYLLPRTLEKKIGYFNKCP